MLPSGEQLRHVMRLCFQASNDVAEYESLVNILCVAVELGVQHLDVWGDSQLIVGQVRKESECRDPEMVANCREVRQVEDKFDGLEIKHIPW